MEKLLQEILEYLETTKRDHYNCEEDTFYSCPKHPESTAIYDLDGCNCGADAFNSKLNVMITKIKENIK
jgi:hypothetical protein